MRLCSMLRLEGVKGNAKVRLPERRHIKNSMLDGAILPTTQGIKFIRSSRSVKRGSGSFSMAREIPVPIIAQEACLRLWRDGLLW